MPMQYVKVEPHLVKRLVPEAEKAPMVARLPVEKRRIARLCAFCADCEQPVVVDKLNRYRHVA